MDVSSSSFVLLLIPTDPAPPGRRLAPRHVTRPQVSSNAFFPRAASPYRQNIVIGGDHPDAIAVCAFQQRAGLLAIAASGTS
jgi:hypothetical protein